MLFYLGPSGQKFKSSEQLLYCENQGDIFEFVNLEYKRLNVAKVVKLEALKFSEHIQSASTVLYSYIYTRNHVWTSQRCT